MATRLNSDLLYLQSGQEVFSLQGRINRPLSKGEQVRLDFDLAELFITYLEHFTHVCLVAVNRCTFWQTVPRSLNAQSLSLLLVD